MRAQRWPPACAPSGSRRPLSSTFASRAPFFAPSLSRLFVGRLLQLPETYGDVHCYGPVRREDIVDVWQPGHRDYDCHVLPRG
jgi:hypothetical protein